MGMFLKLLEGEWPDQDFLTVRPGQKVIATNDDKMIGVRVCPARWPISF